MQTQADLLDRPTHVQVLPSPNLPIVANPTDLESALNRWGITRPDVDSRSIPLSEIPDIDPIVLVK